MLLLLLLLLMMLVLLLVHPSWRHFQVAVLVNGRLRLRRRDLGTRVLFLLLRALEVQEVQEAGQVGHPLRRSWGRAVHQSAAG